MAGYAKPHAYMQKCAWHAYTHRPRMNKGSSRMAETLPVGLMGVEPTTFCSGDRRSIH